MSDYLSRAVEREISAAPGVRPALPSLFDSGQASAAVTTLETEGQIENSSRHEPLAVNAPVAGVAAASTPTRRDEVMPRRPSVSFLDEPVAPPPATVFPTESNSSPQGQQPFAATKPLVRPAAEAPLGTTPVAAVEQVVRPTNPPKAPQATPATGQPIPPVPRPPALRSTHGSTEPTSETSAAVPRAAQARPAVSRVSPAPSSLESSRHSRVARNDSSSPRAIHITIGRIEVRAVHPPPEPVVQRPRPASPKISLDEYLKQRNGGRR